MPKWREYGAVFFRVHTASGTVKGNFIFIRSFARAFLPPSLTRTAFYDSFLAFSLLRSFEFLSLALLMRLRVAKVFCVLESCVSLSVLFTFPWSVLWTTWFGWKTVRGLRFSFVSSLRAFDSSCNENKSFRKIVFALERSIQGGNVLHMRTC